MPYDRLLAHDLLARHGDPAERAHHLARTRELSVQLELDQR
jgi:hypothetical protein